MFRTLLELICRRPKYVWRNKDHDIPVIFIEVAGVANGVEYAQVEYEGVQSFVPMNELIIIR